MANNPGTWPQDEAAVSARLAAIEQRLSEISKRLDELKNLVATLSELSPDRQRLTEGSAVTTNLRRVRRP